MRCINYIKLLALFFPFFILGCSSTTIGKGKIEKVDGDERKPIRFQIHEDVFTDDSNVTATLTNGEVFAGKIVFLEKLKKDVGNIYSSEENLDRDPNINRPIMGYNADARSVLFSKSRSMRCWLTLNNPNLGFSSGGTGQCKISTGEVASVQF